MTGPERKRRGECGFCGILLAAAFMVVGYALAFYVTFLRLHG
jgi:hypothetical protein